MAAIGHPIVGDGKYGGADSFLTGGISRKLHLHARRLKIDGLDGKPIDQTAELPMHFEESLATLGFDRMAGDMMPLDTPDPAKTPEAKARRASAHAKSVRKARKGERRARGGAKPVKQPAKRK
jgi:23S rRNA pseudouridine955/2504/2580 synthase